MKDSILSVSNQVQQHHLSLPLKGVISFGKEFDSLGYGFITVKLEF